MSGRVQVYKTDEVVVTFDPGLCRHTGICLAGLPEVFDIRRARWIRLEAAGVEAIETQVANCPSGALTCDRISAP